MIEARYLATSLSDALVVDKDAYADRAKTRLLDAGFTQAPVVHRGALIGWVSAESLSDSALVQDAYTDLTASRFCGSAASVNDVLPHLSDTAFCFVVGRTGIDSFIVPSDLDRHAARSHFYNLIAGVEIGVSQVIRHVVAIEQVELAISDRPRFDGGPSLRAAYIEARAHDVDTHPVEYLYLGDMIRLLRAAGAAASRLLTCLTTVESLRNAVMHPTKSLSSHGAARLRQVADHAVEAMPLLSGIPLSRDNSGDDQLPLLLEDS